LIDLDGELVDWNGESIDLCINRSYSALINPTRYINSKCLQILNVKPTSFVVAMSHRSPPVLHLAQVLGLEKAQALEKWAAALEMVLILLWFSITLW